MAEYIEREAAKNILFQHQHRFTCADEANGYGSVKWSEDVIYLSKAVNGMDAIPAADVRPVVRGKWTCRRTLEHDGDWWCTACGNELTIYMGNRPDRYKYCPNCGADMREKNDEKA